MLHSQRPDDDLSTALRISQHALLLATTCLLEEAGLVHPVILDDALHPYHQQQRQRVIGLIDQLLRFCRLSQDVTLQTDFVRHELRYMTYQHHNPPSRR